MAFVSKRKYCYFKENNIKKFDYKDEKLLRRFVTEHGKIMPRRETRTSSKMHRKLVRAIKRARNIALMPYANVERRLKLYVIKLRD
ncbi:MAG: 30S ribosomal protein S18 [Candidatus Neomarinimicrobiota bacterium]|nr:MAG: 30S ribosomal protein S18 [Candidatus Neomarinimicrobiota bacterium]